MNEMLEPALVLKKQKVRTCHLLPLKLEPPSNDVLKPMWSSLCGETSPSEQAEAVNKLGELSRNSNNDAAVGEVFDILCQSLFQCPPKAQLMFKINIALNLLHQSKPAIFAAKVQEVILKLHSEKIVGPGKLCHALALVASAKLINFDLAFSAQKEIISSLPNDREDKNRDCDMLCKKFAALKCGKTSGLKTSMMELHEKLCEVVLRHLESLSAAAFDDNTPHVEVSAKQQALQQVMKSTVIYVQSLTFENHDLDQIQNDHLSTEALSPMTHLSFISLKILRAETSTLDLRLVCGQLLAVVANLCPGGVTPLISAGLYGSTDCPTKFSVPVEVVTEVANLPVLGKIAVLHGVLCTVSASELLSKKIEDQGEHGHKIFGIELLKYIFAVGNSSDDGEVTVSCSRLLNHWTLRVLSESNSCTTFAMMVPPESDLEKKLLEHLEFTWEHYLDRVKHTTYETFMNFLEIRKAALGEDSQAYFMAQAARLASVVPRKKFAVSALRCSVKYVKVQELLQLCPTLPLTLVKCLSDFAMASCCSEAVKALFVVHYREISAEEWQEFWVPLLFDNFTLEMMSFGFELLIKNFLETNPSCLGYAVKHVLKRGRSLNYEHYMLLISCLKVGKNFKITNLESNASDPESAFQGDKLWRNMIPYSILQRCLFHVDEWVQISAFGLVCESKKLTESLVDEELNVLIDFFERNFSNDVPSRRQAMRAAAKHLFQRIFNCYKAAKKITDKGSKRGIDPATDPVLQEAVKELARYKSFCDTILNILFLYSHPSYCYSRRCCALWILCDYHNIIGKDDATVEISICHHVNSTTFCYDLLNCLNDNYLHNKEIATELLLSADAFEVDNKHLFECVFSLASSCKPPDSLTACHMLKFLLMSSKPLVYNGHHFDSKPMLNMCCYILSRLEDEIKEASEDIFAAAASHPVYGLLSLVRVAFWRVSAKDIEENRSEWCHFLEKVVALCRNVHSHVRFVVENDSPEGNIPLSLPTLEKVVEHSIGNRNSITSSDLSLTNAETLLSDRVSKATGVSAQMLLLCAWRTVKEISGLFADICQHHFVIFSSKNTFTSDIFKEISEYFIQVLALTKHRGAFEQTYAEYLRVSEQLWLSKDTKLSSVPEEWIGTIIEDINSEPDGRFCATRRSAGIPFIILGALATEPVVRGHSCLRNTMTSLLQLASGTSTLSSDARLHALNILRVLYRDTKLGDVIIPFVSDGVKAAVRGFSSEVWSIRNSSTILFAALVTRMLGVKRNKDDLNSKNSMSALLFFKRYPDLYDFLLQKLEEGIREIAGDQLVASLFPVLLLLARLSPSPLEGMSSSLTLSTFVPLVIQCSQSQILQLRDLSSRALCPLVSVDSLQDTFHILCQQARSVAHNSIHGALLCMYRLLEAFIAHLKKNNLKTSIVTDVTSLFHLATRRNPCCVTRCVTLDIFRLLYEQRCLVSFPDLVKNLAEVLMEILHSEAVNNHVPWLPLMQKSAAEFFIALTADSSLQNLENDLLVLVNSESPFVRTAAYHHVKNRTLSRSLLQRTVANAIQEEDLECRLAAYDVILKSLHTADLMNTEMSQPFNSGTHSSSEDNKNLTPDRRVTEQCNQPVSCDLGILKQLLEHLLLKAGGKTDSSARLRNDELACIIPLLRSLVCVLQDQCVSASAELAFLVRQWSDADQTLDVRLEAARTSVPLLRLLLLTRGPSRTLQLYQRDTVLFEVLECICLQLQDDDSVVRTAAASAWLILLRVIDDPDKYRREFSPVDDLKRQFGVKAPCPNPLFESKSALESRSTNFVSQPHVQDELRTLNDKSRSTPAEGGSDGGGSIAVAANEISKKEGEPHPLCEAAFRAVMSTMGHHGLYGGSIFGFTSLCVDRVMKAVLLFIGHIGGLHAVSLLCSLVLRELCPVEFGLSEENDRAFDKSETSTHKEELLFAEYVIEGLLSTDLMETPCVDVEVLLPHLTYLQDEYQCSQRCCQLPDLSHSSPENPFKRLEHLIRNEICYICSRLSEKLTFSWQLTSANPWLVKLYKLVLLLHTIAQFSKNSSLSNCEFLKATFKRVDETLSQQILRTSLVSKICSIVCHYMGPERS